MCPLSVLGPPDPGVGWLVVPGGPGPTGEGCLLWRPARAHSIGWRPRGRPGGGRLARVHQRVQADALRYVE